MSCVVCGEKTREKLRVDGVAIRACSGCGLGFWRPEPGFRSQRLYDRDYFTAGGRGHGYDDYGEQEASLRLTFARRLARMPRPAPSARLLDIGAAFGFGIDEARRAGWRATGLEISQDAARDAARSVPGRVIVADALITPFAPATFEVVTLWDVLEHLPDPHRAVAEVARVLRPGGRLVLTTGDAGSLLARLSGTRWHLYTLPEHLFFYTRRSLHLLLQAHGLRVVSQRAEGAFYTLGYLVERLRKVLLRRSASRSARWPGARLRIPLNLFDIVTVEAVREGGD